MELVKAILAATHSWVTIGIIEGLQIQNLSYIALLKSTLLNFWSTGMSIGTLKEHSEQFLIERGVTGQKNCPQAASNALKLLQQHLSLIQVMNLQNITANK